ncbi:MAG: hypothetical protein FJY85_24750 [Deltaproteobacteria bacterium]|nr:hypothetical protein [Deltaproteobacteria bacterium]
MGERKIEQETETVVREVMKFAEGHDTTEKATFEAVLDKIMACVHQNTGIDMQAIAQQTDKAIGELPGENGPLGEDREVWEAMIAHV